MKETDSDGADEVRAGDAPLGAKWHLAVAGLVLASALINLVRGRLALVAIAATAACLHFAVWRGRRRGWWPLSGDVAKDAALIAVVVWLGLGIAGLGYALSVFAGGAGTEGKDAAMASMAATGGVAALTIGLMSLRVWRSWRKRDNP